MIISKVLIWEVSNKDGWTVTTFNRQSMINELCYILAAQASYFNHDFYNACLC